MQIFRVGEVCSFLKLLISNVEELNDIWIAGEVSNYSQSAKGHIYFSLKDEEGQLSAVLFRQHALWQTSRLRNGLSVVVHGEVSVYAETGRLQIVADEVQEEGVGRLALAFDELKAQLEAEGLFALERKRPLPPQPRVIGIVTSAQAAAYQDILNVLGRRYPLARVILSPTIVQGEGAPAAIVAALAELNRQPGVEVIIVARGGGSAEDLAAFNDERVARAVFASRLPVVSGVGHETDSTIIDYVADLRAPTPSAAAELVSPDFRDIAAHVQELRAVAASYLLDAYETSKRRLLLSQLRGQRLSPRKLIINGTLRVDQDTTRAANRLQGATNLGKLRLLTLRARAKALDPTAVLARGYAIIRNQQSGEIVTTADQVAPYSMIEIELGGSSFIARRLAKRKE